MFGVQAAATPTWCLYTQISRQGLACPVGDSLVWIRPLWPRLGVWFGRWVVAPLAPQPEGRAVRYLLSCGQDWTKSQKVQVAIQNQLMLSETTHVSWLVGPTEEQNLGFFIDQQRKDIHCIEFILVCKLYWVSGLSTTQQKNVTKMHLISWCSISHLWNGNCVP